MGSFDVTKIGQNFGNLLPMRGITPQVKPTVTTPEKTNTNLVGIKQPPSAATMAAINNIGTARPAQSPEKINTFTGLKPTLNENTRNIIANIDKPKVNGISNTTTAYVGIINPNLNDVSVTGSKGFGKANTVCIA